MKKKILSMFLVGMMSMMLSGCGNAVSDAENVVKQEPAEAEETQGSDESEEIAEVEVTEVKEPEIITVYLMTKDTIKRGEEGEYYGTIETTMEYEYDEYGNQTYWGGYEYEYDDIGRVLKKVKYSVNDSGETFKSGETEYEYDDKGALIKSTGIYYEDEEWAEAFGTTHTVYESEYDDRGNVIKNISKSYKADGSEEIEEDNYEYEYDTEDRIIKETWIFSTGEKAVTEKQYDENGSETKYKYFFINLDGTEEVMEEYELIYEYEYDDAGNLVKRITYNKEELDKKSAEDEYDANGNIIRSTQYHSEDWIDIHEYEYVEMQIPNVPKVK